MTGWQIILISAGCVAFYAAVAAGLSASVHPLRLRIADHSEQLLARDDLPNSEKKKIRSTLGLIFSGKAAWVLAVFFFWRTMTRPFSRSSPAIFADVPNKYSDDLYRFYGGCALCIFANSPAALIFAAILVFVRAVVFRSIDRALRDIYRSISSDDNWGGRNYQH